MKFRCFSAALLMAFAVTSIDAISIDAAGLAEADKGSGGGVPLMKLEPRPARSIISSNGCCGKGDGGGTPQCGGTCCKAHSALDPYCPTGCHGDKPRCMGCRQFGAKTNGRDDPSPAGEKGGADAKKDGKDGKDGAKDGAKDAKDSKDGKDAAKGADASKDAKDGKDSKDGAKGADASKDSKDGAKDSKDGKPAAASGSDRKSSAADAKKADGKPAGAADSKPGDKKGGVSEAVKGAATDFAKKFGADA